MRLDELNRNIRNHNAQIRRRVDGGVSSAPIVFAVAITRSSRKGSKDNSLSMEEAANALASTHSALAKLARLATGNERRRLKSLMDIVLKDLHVVTQKILKNEGGRYRGITDQINASKDNLNDAHEEATSKLANIRNATQILNAFGRLVAAIR